MPFAYGILKPRIILPAPLIACLDDHELRSILTHEDAHCRRRDPLRGAIERIAFSLFFFYPPLWWILRQLRRSAEFDCDQRATQTTGDPGSFSSALAKALAIALPQSPSHAALDLRWPGLLRERLHRIDNMERYNTMKTQRAITLAAVLVVLASSFFAIPVSGGDPQILAPAVMNSQAPETGVEAPMLVQGDVVPPALLDRTPPEYPKDARAGKAEGKVILQAVIEKDGTLSSVTHLRDIACYPSLGQAAEIAVGKWRYNPATLNGAPVRVYFTIVMEFSLGTPPEIPALLELNPVARPVDLSFNAVPLAKVFDALSEASGIKFRIDRSVPADTLVSICRTGSPLKSQLEKLASEWKLRYEVMDASTLRVLAAN